MDKLWDHDDRYHRADEFVEIVEALWSSWDPDAVVMDRETGTYADYSKVRPIDFRGGAYNVRGPLQHTAAAERQASTQPGGSPRGREFAARHADTVIAAAVGIDAMKEYRDDVRKRARGMGVIRTRSR